jgi:hypothetical protein
MDLPGVLSSIAEVSITLADFSAVLRAFRGSDDPDGFSDVRLTVVIEGGLVVAFLCYLPAWSDSAGLSLDSVWRTSSALGAVWTFFRFVLPTIAIYRSASSLPVLYAAAIPPNATCFVAFAANAVGAFPLSTYSGYLLGVIAMLSCVGMIFIAQFIAERRSGSPAV